MTENITEEMEKDVPYRMSYCANSDLTQDVFFTS